MEKAEIAKSRSTVYKLLSKVFVKEVTTEFLDILGEQDISESLKELGIDLRKCLNGNDRDKLIEELATEYSALFLQPGGLSPHESVRLHGLLFQEPATKVFEFYKECGLEIPEGYKGFPDQLGVELEFMGYLAENESEAWKKGEPEKAVEFEKLQKRFLEEHLAKWVVKFCKEAEEVSFHPFYKEMIGLTGKFMETEIEELLTTENTEIKNECTEL